MIDVRVINIQPHPAQATHNPGCWAVQLEVSYDGKKRTFWRWYTVRALDGLGRYVTPSNEMKPTVDEILTQFWDSTFGDLHGFAFDKAAP